MHLVIFIYVHIFKLYKGICLEYIRVKTKFYNGIYPSRVLFQNILKSTRHNDHRSILVTRTQKVDISKEGVGKKQGYLMEVKTIRCIIVINEKKHYVLEINLEFF